MNSSLLLNKFCIYGLIQCVSRSNSLRKTPLSELTQNPIALGKQAQYNVTVTNPRFGGSRCEILVVLPAWGIHKIPQVNKIKFSFLTWAVNFRSCIEELMTCAQAWLRLSVSTYCTSDPGHLHVYFLHEHSHVRSKWTRLWQTVVGSWFYSIIQRSLKPLHCTSILVFSIMWNVLKSCFRAHLLKHMLKAQYHYNQQDMESQC